MKRAPTITDVARLAGTSAATVSRFFSDPSRVNDKTAARIEEAAAELNYIRNRAAAATRHRRSGSIGMVVPTLESSIFAELIESLTGQLRLHGQTMLIASNRYDVSSELEAVKTYAEHGVDGVILVGVDHEPQTLSVLSTRTIPILCVWNHPNEKNASLGLDSIGVDNYEIGYAAARHLVELGHREIGCIFGKPAGNDRAEARSDGMIDMLAGAEVMPPAEWLCHSSYELRHASIIATNLLNKAHRPKAILCGNDIIAFATIWAAQKLGLSVPDDLSVMGIGDFQGAAEMTPPLSTIRIPARIIGRMSADRIMAMIAQPDDTPTRHLKVDFEMKIRGSTAPPKPTP